MIDRFNFFDVYGYLIPGLSLLALSFAPLIVVGALSPDIDLGSALAWVVLGYVLGLLLHAVARHLIPAFKVQDGMDVYDSMEALDSQHCRFDASTLTRLQASIRKAFGLETAGGKSVDLLRSRRDAFYCCRSWLLRRKLAGYSEQFEGMYSMFRSVSAASWMGSAYAIGFFAGTAVHAQGNSEGMTSAMFLLLVGVLAALLVQVCWKYEWMKRKSIGRVIAGLWVIAAAITGTLIGSRLSASHAQQATLVLLAAFAGLIGRISMKQFQFFNRQFSDTVYRDFLESYRDSSESSSVDHATREE